MTDGPGPLHPPGSLADFLLGFLRWWPGSWASCAGGLLAGLLAIPLVPSSEAARSPCAPRDCRPTPALVFTPLQLLSLHLYYPTYPVLLLFPADWCFSSPPPLPSPRGGSPSVTPGESSLCTGRYNGEGVQVSVAVNPAHMEAFTSNFYDALRASFCTQKN